MTSFRGIVAMLVLVWGCGRIDFARKVTADAPIDTASDTASDTPSDTPSDIAAASCIPGATFGAPRLVAELSSAALDGTFRLLDDNSGYFWSSRSGDNDIYFASRPDEATAFSIQLVAGLNTTANEVDPTISSDGALMLFRRSSGGDDIYGAKRAGGPTSFDPPAVSTKLSGPSADTQPFLQPGGNEMYYCSYRTGQGDLYRAFRSGDMFTDPVLVGELSEPAAGEGDPVIARDGLTIYFRSDRPGGKGGFDIYVAKRQDTGAQFEAPQLLPNVNGAVDDGPSALSSDDCHLYISSDRAGTNDIYVATRGVP